MSHYSQQRFSPAFEPESPVLDDEILETEVAAENRGYFDTQDRSRADHRSFELTFIERSGLFDASFYLSTYSDGAATGVSALEHFFDFGYRKGRRPNLYFDPEWYFTQNPDVRESGLPPLAHYVSYGDIEGRRPSLLFDTPWYRKTYNVGSVECALAHYMKHCKECRLSPIPDFDVEFYARSYPDVAAAGIDPFQHFVLYGYNEGRAPSAHFDAKFYRMRYLGGDTGRNPFLHFLAHKHEPGVVGRMPESEASIPREVKRFTQAGPEFEEFVPLPPSARVRAKLLAYYLPQFHEFPENNAWWGKGFTEWANVPRGLPRFKGHYQPRIPRDLGYYSLSNAETIRRQAEMAKAAGVFGFVFYYYWFNGKRLLEKPVEAFLSDSSIQMPFCLMWANENWTRRWDGADSDVLISQDYRVEDEAALIANFARHFGDDRYIRLQGRPLLMIYRPGLIIDGSKTLMRWRRLFQDRFNEDPILVMGQTFNAGDPSAFGMDGAIEFPPHKLTQDMQPINSTLHYLDIEFEGKAYRYDEVVRVSLQESKTHYPLIKTAVPSWDNDSRRQGNGLVLTESSPQKYQAWLSELVDRAVENPFFGESLVCVNAWNEWCEGAYLEPDLHYGAAYLNATGRALLGKPNNHAQGRIVLVGHDAFPSGAQHLLLHVGRTLRSHYGVETSVILMDGGKLEETYRELGSLTVVRSTAQLEAVIWSLKDAGYTAAIVNTSAAASAIPYLKKAGMEVTLLVHELPRLLREKHLGAHAKTAARQARHIVFPAAFVRDQYCQELGLDATANMLVFPQGMYHPIGLSREAGDTLRAEFGVRKGQKLVLGMGYADLRKGFDLFLQLWRLVRNSRSLVTHFCWVGDIDPALKEWMQNEITDAQATGTFHLPGYRRDVSAFLSAANAFALTSREDPFPSVVLEALYAGLPVTAFDRSGGMPDVLRDHPLGHVVPFADTVAMAEALVAVTHKAPSEAARLAGFDLVTHRFDFPSYVWRLLQLAQTELPTIAVAVPNFNYAQHMPQRLSSIFLQTQTIKEVLVLDDCSTDDSLTVIPAIAEEWKRHIRVLPNQKNSGSVFEQWRKSANNSTSEFLWIAEADDLSAPGFLSAVIALMHHDSTIQFAFSDSQAIDAAGEVLWPSYKSYYASVASDALTRSGVFEGEDFVTRYLAVKNLVLNVSAVIWRRQALLDAMQACEKDLHGYKMASDWRLYLQALSTPGARVGYCAEPLNIHRRHAASVTHALAANQHVAEIAACHAFAGTAFRLSNDTRAAQHRYLQEIRTQLGASPIAEPAAPITANRRPTRAI